VLYASLDVHAPVDVAGPHFALERGTRVAVLEGHQPGKPHAAMAWLYLPSIWPDDAGAALSEALAAALAEAVVVDLSSVQIGA
jgi:hypothetical protein